MKFKKVAALMMAAVMVASFAAACNQEEPDTPVTSGEDTSVTDPIEGDVDKVYTEDEIIDFTMFAAMPGSEINEGNEIQQLIAEKTGVRVKETWLTGQTAAEAVGTIIAGGDLPDFIDGGDGMMQLYENDCLVAWDEYIEKYPNIKEMYTDAEWEMFRQEDGHIYWANVFQNSYGENRATGHNDEAFWIQVKVLEWDNYPKIETMDQYFDLLERYYAANPTMEDGTEHIPYTILCEDWRYFCLENAGQFLAGYPNDGSVIVNKQTLKIEDYNTSDATYKYFKKLNEEYQKGMIDKEFATQTYDEYIAKLSTGRVLGMVDQWWDFAFTVNDVFKQQGLDLKGANYVPLGLTIEPGMENRWHTYGDTVNNSSGVGVTTSCEDPDRAFQFLNDVLDQEIHDLRFWGVEGVDYLVDEEGLYYRTEEMRTKAADDAYQASHLCTYSYLPQWGGTSKDGKNAMQPQEQKSEFFVGLADPLKKCFEAYGADSYPDMIGSVVEENAVWFPMYSHSNAMTTDTPGGVAWTKMGEVKHEWLPKVVMDKDFDKTWDAYMVKYNECKPEDFLAEMQTELERRIAMAEEAAK